MRFKMDDGRVVDTRSAARHWEEDQIWDGWHMISRATGSQFDHQGLFKTKRDDYYLVRSCDWSGSVPSAEWISPRDAATWLLTQGYDLPDALASFAEQT